MHNIAVFCVVNAMACCLLHGNMLANLHLIFFSCCLIISPSAITSGSLRDPFGMRAQPCPMLHAHSPAPRFSPRRPHYPIFTHSFTDILSAFIQNRLQPQKSSREVLPVRQKCVPLHSLSEREAQATSEWIFDRLRTANKTRQR